MPNGAVRSGPRGPVRDAQALAELGTRDPAVA
jgi:hypothetical protein